MVRHNFAFKSNFSNNSFQNTKIVKYYFYTFFSKIFYFILLILSVVILNTNINNKAIDNFIREKILYVSKPIFVLAKAPFNLFFDIIDMTKDIVMISFENNKLKKENIYLRKLYIESKDITTENENLKKLLNFKNTFENDYDYIASRVYMDPKNGISNSIILNLGTNDGVEEGNLVLGINRGVIGRVINISKTTSNVLLINDINSRIPARTADTKERIILSGTNKNYLEISYFNSKIPEIKDGDFVYTSGDSNIIPDGFYIGIIKKYKDKYIVEMNETFSNIFNIIVIRPKLNSL